MIPNNYKINYTFDGYKFFEVVSAYSPEQATEYFQWINPDARNIVSEDTPVDEIASYYCVDENWQKPESVEQAKHRSYHTWLKNYLGNFINSDGVILETPELKAFLEADGWTRHEEDVPEFNQFGLEGKRVYYTGGTHWEYIIEVW